MKNLFYILTFTFIFSPACNPDDTAAPASPSILAPVARFTISTSNLTNGSIVADQTNAVFLGEASTGEIDSYTWDFENGSGIDTGIQGSHVFDFAGNRTVKLTVTGPGGSDSDTQEIPIRAFSANCENFGSSNTYSAEVINQFRNDNLVQIGSVRIINSYSDALSITMYSPNKWLDGIYTPSATHSISGSETKTLPLNYANEWGIRIAGANGGKSCVRTLGRVAESFNNGQYTIRTADIQTGN